MMTLLQAHSLIAVAQFQPESQPLNLAERASTSSIVVGPAAPEIAEGDWIRDDTEPGAGIVWRVKTVEDNFDNETRTIQLEHIINTLRDTLVFGEVKPSDMGGSTNCTAVQAITYMLARQSESDWVLGTCDYDVSNPYNFSSDYIYDALETVSSSLPDCWWEYDMTSYPFTINIVERAAAVSVEMRMSRNIKKAKRNVDRSRMYTRIYPIGKNNLHIDGNFRSKNENLYGRIDKTVTDQSKATKAELQRWADELLDRHCQPTMTVTVSALDLSKGTGESLDHIVLGAMCRMPLPKKNILIEEIITKINYPDKIKEPDKATVTMANVREDVASIINQLIKSGGASGKTHAKQGEEDHAWIEDTTDHVKLVAEAIIGKDGDNPVNWSRVSELGVDGEGIHGRVTATEGDMVVAKAQITVNENAIAAEVTRATSAESSMNAAITIQANRITQEVSDRQGDVATLQGSITIESNRITQEVTDRTNADNTLQANITIEANRITQEVSDRQGDVATLQGSITIESNRITQEVTDRTNADSTLQANITIEANRITQEVSDRQGDVATLQGSITIESNRITQEVTDRTNADSTLDGKITVEAGKISQIVTAVGDNGEVTAASICLAINGSNESNATINASKIYLLGQTIADTITANYIDGKVATLPVLHGMSASFSGSIRVGSTIYLGSDPTDLSGNLANAVRDLQIVPSGNNYKLQKKDYNDSDWVDVGTFSRATTLSGQWSGRNFTVTASPQGNIKVGTVYNEIVPDTSDPVEYTVDGNNHYVARDYIVYSEDENGDADTLILKKEIKISADAAYTDGYNDGYSDGSASGGSTILTNQWSGGVITVTASPQGATLQRALVADTPTWNGTTATIPIHSKYGNSGQYDEGVVFSPTVNVSSKLQSKTFTSNGTKTPDSGYIGFSSVVVNVPATDVKAHFGKNGSTGQYYIEAVDTNSGDQISGSLVNYSLTVSGKNVTIGAGSGQTVPSIELGINSGSVNSAGSRTLTVTAGGSNTTATVTITDYAGGWAAARTSTGDFPTAAVAEADRAQYITVKRPNSTVGGTATSYSYYVTSDNDKAYIRYGSTSGNIIAQVTHNKYTTGYNAGVTAGKNAVGLSINTNNAKITRNQSSNAITEVQISIDTGSVNSSGNRTVTVKANTTTLLTNVLSDYANGWGAARTSTGDFPTAAVTESSRLQYITVKRPNSTVGGTATSYNYYVTSDNDKAYIRYGSTSGSIIAQVTHNKYTTGYNAGVTAGKNAVGLSINTNNAKITRNQSSNAITEVQISIDTGSVNSSGNRTVTVKANTTTLLSTVISDYANGKTAVWNGVSISNTGGTTYSVQSGSGANKVIRIPFQTVVSSSGMTNKTKDDYWQQTPTNIWHDAYTEGMSNASHTITEYATTSPIGASKVVSGTTYTNSSRMYAKSGSNEDATVIIVTGGSWKCDGKSRTHNAYNWLQTAPSNIWHDAYIAGYDANHSMFIGDANYNAKPGVINVNVGTDQEVWAYFKKKGSNEYLWSSKYTLHAIGGTHSVTITQNSNWRGYSKEDVLDRMGISSFSYEWGIGSGTPYWGFKATCGGSTKYFLVYRA